MKTRLRKGDKVTVYEDPISEQKREGIAEVVRNHGEVGDDLQLCEVRFAEDGDSLFFRRLNPKNKIRPGAAPLGR